MNRNLYKKTFLLISVGYMTLMALLILLNEQILKINGFFYLYIGLTIGFLFILATFTISFRKYSPLYQKTKRDSRIINLLYSLIKTTNHIDDLESLFDSILTSAVIAIDNADRGCVLLLEPNTNQLNFVAAYGYDLDFLQSTYIDLHQSYLYRESSGRIEHTLIIDDPFEYDRVNIPDENIKVLLNDECFEVRTTLSTPIIYDDKLFGMINIESTIKNAFTQEDVHTAEMFTHEIVSILKNFNAVEKQTFATNHDPLTECYNRYFLLDFLIDTVKKTPEHMFSLIDLDIKDFKRINQEHGYEAADRLLKEFSQRLRDITPTLSKVARFGDNEFMIYIPQYDNEQCENFIARLLEGLESSPLECHKASILLEINTGFASYPEDSSDVRQLLKLADTRLSIHPNN